MTIMSRLARLSRTFLLALVASTTLIAAACDEGTAPSPRTVASVRVLPTEPTLVVGEELALEARPLDERGEIIEGRAVVWSSSDDAVARVAADGRVTALAVGRVTIRATVDGKSGLAELVVTLAPVARVEVTPATISMEEGDARVVVAVALDAAGRVLGGRAITWTSSAPMVAEVDATGRITAKRPGTSTVTATVEGKHADVPIAVTRVAVDWIGVTPTGFILEVGQSRQLTAITKDARGNVLTGREVTWTTDDANVTVSGAGVVTAVQPGYATVTATSEGKTFSVAMTVVAEEPSDYDLVYHRPGLPSGYEIFVLALGSGAAPIRINAGTVSSQATASPDGARIAFAVSQVDLGTQQSVEDIFAVDRTGMNVKRLTTAAGTDDQPSWSPAGGRIAYRHYEPNGRMDVWIMNADGSSPLNLTADFPADTHLSAPAWSSDGTRIAFASIHSDAAGTTAGIWTMRADGSDKRRLTTTLTGFDATPTWAPDGERIAFIRYYAGDADIAIVSEAGGEPVRLPLAGHQWTPAWSPDGRFIAFAQGGLVTNLYTVTPNGTDLRLRTTDPAWGGGFDPAWIRKP
jgi:Tol biopolymer transport system component/uncharacterized protein YjdB